MLLNLFSSLSMFPVFQALTASIIAASNGQYLTNSIDINVLHVAFLLLTSIHDEGNKRISTTGMRDMRSHTLQEIALMRHISHNGLVERTFTTC